jgi:hypothetical protein
MHLTQGNGLPPRRRSSSRFSPTSPSHDPGTSPLNSAAFIENIGMPGLCCLAVIVPFAAIVLIATVLAKQSGSRGSGGADRD